MSRTKTRNLKPQQRTKETVSVSLPPVGRNNPAARAYSNDRRAGRTHPGKIEMRRPGGIVGRIADAVLNGGLR